MSSRIAMVVALALAGCVGNQESETTQASTGPVSLAVTPATAKLPVEALQQLTATGTYADGTKKTLTTMVAWASSSPSVASVNAAGVVTALAVGTATISAIADGGVVASSAITVSTATLRSVAPTPTSASIVAGYTKQLVAQGTWSDGTKHNVANAMWATSASAIASVDATGLVSGLAAGSATITVSHAGATSGTSAITVTPAILKTIAVTPAAPTYPLGIHPRLHATGTFSDGSTHDLTATVIWTSSAPAVAAVDGTGQLVTLTTGATTITATSGTIKGTDSVHVSKATLARLDISPPNAQLPKGTNLSLTAFGTFTDSSGFDLTDQVTWSTDDPGVATIAPSGRLTTVAPGATVLRASDPGTGIAGSTPFVTNYAVLLGIGVTPTSATIDLGQNIQFAATGYYSDGSQHDLTEVVDWSASAPEVAGISDAYGTKGLATATALGSTTIAAVEPISLATSQVSLVVKPVEQLALVITPGALKIPLGYTDVLRALATYDNGTASYDPVMWSSDAPSIATVDGSGLVASHAIGTAHLTATGPQAGFTQTITVTISPAVFAQPIAYPTGGNPQIVRIADIDEDGRPDILTDDYFDGVHVLRATGPASEVDVGGLVSALDVGDLDGDGHLDLAVLNYTLDTLSIAYGHGDGTFDAPVTVTPNVGFLYISVHIVDLDGDGHADLVYSRHDNHIVVSFGHGDRTFDAPFDVPLAAMPFDAPSNMTFADLDGDGALDVIVADDNSLRVLTHTAPRAFAETYDSAHGVVPRYVAIGDLDGHGHRGVFASNSSDDRVSVWTLTAGALSFVGNVQVGNAPGQIALADFDGDGVLDFAVAAQGGGTADVSVAIGHGDGTFAAPYTFLVGTAADGVAAVDFDGDGKLDLVTTDSLANTLYVVPNRF